MGDALPSLGLSTLAIPAPNPGPSTVVSSAQHLIAASGKSLHVLNHECCLLETLPFELAFPFHEGLVNALAVDPTSQLVAACSGSKVGIWELAKSGRGWRVHSSFSTGGGRIGELDFANGRIVTASADGEGIALWELEDRGFPSWQKIGWEGQSVPTQIVRLSPSAGILASVASASNVVRLSGIKPGESGGSALAFRSNAWHSLQIRDVRWRPSDNDADSGPILFTTTLTGAFHIWGCMIDEPDFFSLWATLDVHSSIPSHLALATSYMRTVPMHSVEAGKTGNEDEFLTVFEDGSCWVTTVSNFDCRPPTCLSQSSALLHESVFPPATLANLRFPLLVTPSLLLSRCSRSSLFLTDLSHSWPIPQAISISHTGTVKNLLPTFIGESLLVVGDGKVQHWELGDDDQVVETFVARREGWGDEVKVATWHDGRMLVAATPTELQIYELRRSQLRLITSLPFHIDNAPSASGCTESSHSIQTLFVARTSEDSLSTTIVGLSGSLVFSWTYNSASHSISPVPEYSLDESGKQGKIVPVPLKTDGDMTASMGLLRVTEEGELVFWEAQLPSSDYEWKRIAKVRTGRKGVRKAAVSQEGLTAIVASLDEKGEGGGELSLWDSKESEFASGQLHAQLCDGEVVDLHFSPNGYILAVATPAYVQLLHAQRLDDLSGSPSWITFARVVVSQFTASPVTAICWLSGGLAVASGQTIAFHSSKLAGTAGANQDSHAVAERAIGPLPYHHPQFLFQALLHGRTEAVIKVLVDMAAQLTNTGDVTPVRTSRSGARVKMEDFLQKKESAHHSGTATPVDIFLALTSESERPRTGVKQTELTEDDVHRLLAALKKCSLRGLTALEHAHLAVVVQTVYDVQRQRGALDPNGLRYLISMRLFFLYNAPSSTLPTSLDSAPSVTRLKYRDALWAFHSENQDLLVAESMKSSGNKLQWNEAKALSLFLWLKSSTALSAQMESIARAEYVKPDREEKDPVTASLFYLALRKKHMMVTLWRQAHGHSDQRSMIKLLANDFDLPRWKSAALKNAFVLISKQRFLFAAVFFLLGDSLKDAVSVCLRQLDDFQLAIAITRVYEGDDGPVLKSIIEGTVLPLAFKEGFRWLASWSFWMLNRRDLAIETIVTPLADLAAKLPYELVSIGRPPHEDPALVIIFGQLRSWSLQTLKGATSVPGHVEFNFVLHMSRVLTRMGCHVLALNLVQSWEFIPPPKPQRKMQPSPEPVSFPRRGYLRRKSTILDLDIPSNLPSRAASPERAGGAHFHAVLQETKKTQPAKAPPEFDMGSFF